MALGMMGKGPKLRLSDEQRQQIRNVRAEQGRGAARQMRRQMRQEAGLPVRPMQNEPAQMPMPVDQGFQVTPEQMEALRQQQPMQRPTVGMMQDAVGRYERLTPEQMQNMQNMLGGLQGAQQPGVQDRMYRYPMTDMMYRGPVNMTPEMQQALQDRYANVNPVPVQNTNTILPQQPMGVAQGIGQLAQQPNPFMPYKPYGM